MRTRYHVNGSQFIDEHVVTFRASSPGSTNGAFFYYLHGNLYNVIALGDSRGNIVETYNYSAYGLATVPQGVSCLPGDLDADRVVDLADLALFIDCLLDVICPPLPGGTLPGGMAATSNTFFLHGRTVDILSDGLTLQYSRARYYDFKNARWLQRDPLGYVDGNNLYEAFRGNPTSFSDPEGRGAKLASGFNNGDQVFRQRIGFFGGVTEEFPVGEYYFLRGQKIVVYREDFDGLGHHYVLPFKDVEDFAKRNNVDAFDYDDFVRLNAIAFDPTTGKTIERTLGEELRRFFQKAVQEDLQSIETLLNSIDFRNLIAAPFITAATGEDIITGKTVPLRFRVVAGVESALMAAPVFAGVKSILGATGGTRAITGSAVVGRGAIRGGAGVDLFRAVSDAELVDINMTGVFRQKMGPRGTPLSMGTKLFATNIEDAGRFARIVFKNAPQDGPVTLVRVRVSPGGFRTLNPLSIDRLTAISVDSDVLNLFNRSLQQVEFLNTAPLGIAP